MGTNPVRLANGRLLFMPPNGANIIQAGQGIPATVIQPAGSIQHAQYVGQLVGSTNNQPQQNPQLGLLEKFLKVETKTLGAIQILIGLVHIGFGTIAAFINISHFFALTTIGGYPFWGGLFFITSGSVSVSAEKYATRSLVQCSVGMNITSTVMSLAGIFLYIADLAAYYPPPHDNKIYRMANGTVVVIPQIGANVIQTGGGITGTVIQPAGTVQYIQYVGQPAGSPNNQPQQNRQAGLMEKLLKVETKTLGAIQIIIALIHIGFGSVSAVIAGLGYLSIATIGGYPFWGGIFFIVSGSLSVSAEKHLTPGLVRCSVGMNITSAVMAGVGIILYLIQLSLNPSYRYNYDPDYGYGYGYWATPVGTGLSVLLLLFSMLEFCIAVSTAHFGCQAACCTNDPPMVYIPYTVSGVEAAPTERNLPPPPPPAAAAPPAYDSVDFSPKRE
ncbi:membrane-spanning 4-domains subfamily A member 15-like [Rhineura floridana]|uniref:membrane-spanning 4-domains subfamily A member 15-like n=1 Tax=Rhineura floridana TaxID=261503 RepID=UPI002AC82C57|nr:membrane-spanning 4-domains subfamily A member 15-like [Rhineura floridana]